MCTGMEWMMIASTAMQVSGAISGGNQRKQQADYQAAQAEADAKAAKEQATVDAERLRKAGQRQRSQAIAQLAASGVDVGSGSALKIDQSITSGAEQDAQTTLLTGGYRADNLNRNASLMRLSGDNAQTAGYMSAGSSLLAGAGKVKSGWQLSPNAANGSDYNGTWTADGEFDSRTYTKQIWD